MKGVSTERVRKGVKGERSRGERKKSGPMFESPFLSRIGAQGGGGGARGDAVGEVAGRRRAGRHEGVRRPKGRGGGKKKNRWGEIESGRAEKRHV